MNYEYSMNYEDCLNCFGHDFERVDTLPTSSNGYDELLACIHCGYEMVITHNNDSSNNDKI